MTRCPLRCTSLMLLYTVTSYARFLLGPCDQNSCLNGGTCYPNVNSTHWCRCLSSYKGNRCEDPLCGKECLNGGVCLSNDNSTFKCHCILGFTGEHCEHVLSNICERASPCGLRGKCALTSSLEAFKCHCNDGWIGERCDERDPCPTEYCNHGGKCASNGTEFMCICPLGFQGEHCEHDINECHSSPCAFGKCVNTVGSYRCECDAGFIGSDCQVYRSGFECSVTGPNVCRNGGVCIPDEYNNNSTCICPPMFQGLYCEKDVDECSISNPCENGGTCINTEGGFECACTAAFEGELCTVNKNDCINNNCSRGSTCEDLVGSYRCLCPPGRIGSFCQYTNPCHSTLCLNGRCISDPETGNSTCACAHGYTGTYCDEDIDECTEWGEALCHNGATCVNVAGSYTCECPAGVTGEFCDTLMEMCFPNPCNNGGVCVDRLNSFECSCAEGFTGPTCDEKCLRNDHCFCSIRSCLNGGSCRGDKCECSAGFTGKYCEIELNPCDMNRCSTWQICRGNNTSRSINCSCPTGFTGLECKERIDECSTNPCLHGGTCSSRHGKYHCSCLNGYSGKNCEKVMDQCMSDSCLNGGVCVSVAQSNICHCTPAFFGKKCQFERKPCLRNRCDNGAICHPTVNYRNYTCECKPGFEGHFCERDIDECINQPCRNGGTCHNTHGDYKCICGTGYTGKNCFDKTNDCAGDPCHNNGTCIDDLGKFRCLCHPGYTGKSCSVHIDNCVKNPCLNGASCVDGINQYKCVCKEGFSGRDCHINDNDCRPGICLNGGTCVDLVNDYKCNCLRGYTGRNCQISVNLNKFKEMDRLERILCELSDCYSKGGDGECHTECNFFACGFDAGDCSARSQPFVTCSSASYCAHVFKDGHCDSICNNEACLFDGFDCTQAARSCPMDKVGYCRLHVHDGICDEQCNSVECAFDGGDCSGKGSFILPGDISVVVITTPAHFMRNVGLFLLTLSQKLRASIRIKSDKLGPLVFHWNGQPSSERVVFSHNQELSVNYKGEIRPKRAILNVGVLVWIEIDVAGCYNECFTDVNIVANYLGAANAKEDLAEMGMPIYEAIAHHTVFDESLSRSDGYWSFLIGCFAILIVVTTVFVLQQRTRKRRIIKAPFWIPPTETQQKLTTLSQNEQMLRTGFLSNYLLPKRPCLQNMNYYGVPYKDTIKKVQPSVTLLHKQASSNVAIQVEPVNVNVRGPFGRTALMMLCDNIEKPESQLIEEVTKIWAAGGDLNVQDDDEETAIFIAVRRGRLGLVKKLLDMGADPTIMNCNDSTCLHEAAANCNISLVEELLRHSSVVKEIDVCDNNDRTPLMRCAANDAVDHQVAELLIRLGADPSYSGDKSARSYRGRTALHYAAQVNNVQMIEFLLSRDANKDAQDLEDRTPLFLAASHGHVEAVEALVRAGASLEISDRKDRTPYKVAAENEFRSILELLDPDTKKNSVVLHVMANEKNSLKSDTRQVKRITVKRRNQPLTPPHSDGCGSTPSPRATFGVPSRTVASVLDSPSSDRTSIGNNDFSPRSLPVTQSSYCVSDVSDHSPPYEIGDMGICAYYNNYSIRNPSYTSHSLTTASFPSCQYSEQFTSYTKQV